MEQEPRAIEVQINERTYRLLGNVAVALFCEEASRPYAYLIINEENGEITRGHNNPDLCHYMAGYRVETDDDGDYVRRTVIDENGMTFSRRYGWRPSVIEREKAPDDIKEAATQVSIENLDKEWEQGI